MKSIAQIITNWIAGWRQYPICLLGYDIRRWENQMYEYWYNEFTKKLLFMVSKPDKGPTHIQYESPFGFLIQWPLCFHVWYQFKPQDKDAEGNKIPGTERVFYFRVGVVRWDSGDGKYVYGYKNFPIGTWYGPGLHWD